MDKLEAMDASRRPTSPQPAASGTSTSKQDLLWDILIFNSPNRSSASSLGLFSKEFAAPSVEVPNRDAGSMPRPTSSMATQNMQPTADNFQTALGPSAARHYPLPSAAAVAATPGQQPPFTPGVPQYPAAPDPNYMAFNDQNLAAITEFLDQNSGRMFNEWWDFGDL